MTSPIEIGQINKHLMRVRFAVNEITGQCAEQMMRDVLEVLHVPEKMHVAIEMDNITFIDSSGLGVLSVILREVDKASGLIAMVGADPAIKDIVTVSGFRHRMFFYDSISHVLNDTRFA